MVEKKCESQDFDLIDVDDGLGRVADEENEDDCKKESCHCRVPVVDHFQAQIQMGNTILIKLYWIVTNRYLGWLALFSRTRARTFLKD